MAQLVGDTLGPYRILESIGVGGMAEVYKAYQPAMDRYVAIKAILARFAQDKLFLRRFQREARAVSRLEHAHILPVYDYGESKGRPYLVMRYMAAGTLKDRLSETPMPVGEANRIVAQVGSALDYAHRMGIIHRDVKPSNVLVDAEENTFLTDFGLAKMMEASLQLTGTGVGIGTPAYMSPEQGQGETVDSRTDIYSLGVMLYEMVVGRRPYHANTPLAVVYKHIHEPLPLPRAILPSLPEAVERVILRAMAKAPADRFETAGEMVTALDAAVRTAEQAERTGLAGAKPLPRAPERRRKALWLIPVFLVLFAAILAAWRPWAKPQPVVEAKVVATSAATKVALTSASRTALPTLAPTLAATTGGRPSPSPTPEVALTSAPGTPPPTLAPTRPPTPQATSATTPSGLQVSQLALYEESANCFAWSPGSEFLVIGGYSLELYDVQAGRVVRQIDRDGAGEVVFSPDGKILASAAYEGVTLWDVASWSKLQILAGSKDTESVAFSPDGATLVTGTGMTLKVWDVTTGTELRTIPGAGSVRSVAFSPDGQTAASAADDIRLWNVAAGRELKALTEHSNWVNSVVFSPDGKTLASGSVDQTVRLWDVASGRNTRTLVGHSGQIDSVAFSPDGRLLASVSWDLTVRLWEVASGTELAALTGHIGWIRWVAFSPDGTMLASGGQDQMRVWSLSEQEGVGQSTAATTALSPSTPGPTATPVPLSASAISPANAERVILLENLETGWVTDIAWSPDGKVLAIAARNIDFFDSRTLKQVLSIDLNESVDSIAFSPDDASLASASYDGVRLWDAEGGGELRTLAGSKGSSGVAFSPDGTMLATATGMTVKLWEVASGKELSTLVGHGGRVNVVAFSPDGQTVASGAGDIKLWEVSSGREVKTLTEHSNWVNSVVFSPDGKTLASGSVDKTVRLWDVASGRNLRTLVGHSGQIDSVAFSPDGRLLASVSWDLTVRLWDVTTGDEMASLTGHTEWIGWVAFSPDGATLASGSRDGTVRLWGVGE